MKLYRMYCILRVMFAYAVLENAWRIADWPAMKESLHQVWTLTQCNALFTYHECCVC